MADLNALERKLTSDTSAEAELENKRVSLSEEMSIYDKAEIRRILPKVDCRVVPALAVMYLIFFVDRSNIENAKVAGMNEDLGLTGLVITRFFLGIAEAGFFPGSTYLLTTWYCWCEVQLVW
ncbi:Fc.00g116350.m01.CDS01 [Cosmosporella sp. VM-42]